MRFFCLLFLLLTINAFGFSDYTKLADFRIYPLSPVVGQEVTVLILPEKFTGDIELASYIEGQFEGENVHFERLNDDIWKFNSLALTEPGTYSLKARIYIEDKAQSEIARKEIGILTVEIARLDVLITRESDPTMREALILERVTKEAKKEELVTSLSSLRKFLGDETFNFTVTAGLEF